MIGSSTTCGILADFRNIATTSTNSAEPSIPIRTAAILKSEESSRKVSVTSLAATGSTLRTDAVDWTVNAVMHPMPKQLCAAKVLISAVTPAPEEGSNPAMLRTTGGLDGIDEWETSNRNLDEISGDARTIASCSNSGAETSSSLAFHQSRHGGMLTISVQVGPAERQSGRRLPIRLGPPCTKSRPAPPTAGGLTPSKSLALKGFTSVSLLQH